MKIGLDTDFGKLQSVNLKKIENKDKNLTECNEVFKESAIDLQYSRPEAVTYTGRGAYRRNLHNMVTKDNDICDCKKPEFQQKPNLTGRVNVSPQVPVKAVIRMNSGDVIKLGFKACVKPLSDHVQEMGKDNTKRYVVIDGVRYESEIPESERYKAPKTLIELLNEADEERMKYKNKDKNNEYELAGMSKSSVTVGNSEFTVYGQMDEKTIQRIQEVLGTTL